MTTKKELILTGKDEPQNCSGRWNISLWTDCPNCGESFDIYDIEESLGSGGEFPNIEIGIHWEGLNKLEDFKCPECKQELVMYDCEY